MTTPSGERTTESIPTLISATNRHDVAGTDTPTAERMAIGDAAADGGDTPTDELAATFSPRPKNGIPIIAGGVLVAGVAAVLAREEQRVIGDERTGHSTVHDQRR